MSAALIEDEDLTPAGAPDGWRLARPGEWRFERRGEAVTYGVRVLATPAGFIDHVAVTAWNYRTSHLPVHGTEAAELGRALAALGEWLASGGGR